MISRARSWRQFEAEKFRAAYFAFTMLDLSDPDAPASADYRAQEPIYPASAVKLFYLAQAQLESGAACHADFTPQVTSP